LYTRFRKLTYNYYYMKKYISTFFYCFGVFTFLIFCSYFITKGETIIPSSIGDMTFADNKDALIDFFWLIGGCLIATFVLTRKKKVKDVESCEKNSND